MLETQYYLFSFAAPIARTDQRMLTMQVGGGGGVVLVCVVKLQTMQGEEKCNIAQFTDSLPEVLKSLAVAAAHKAHSVGSN